MLPEKIENYLKQNISITKTLLNMKTIHMSLILLALMLSVGNLNAQTVKDIDGNTYKTKTIGEQIWMAENLKTTKYNDGKEIPLEADVAKWDKLTGPAYCYYDNDISNKDEFGALYNWHTVAQKNLCPQDWHVPTKEDWSKLIEFINSGENAETQALTLKSKEGWKRNDGLDSYGFNGVPGGFLSWGGFYYKGEGAYWWSSTEEHSGFIKVWSIDNIRKNVEETILEKKVGASIRCVKD
jgi:uncharacterized protein (TIGR02145 family)